jgi:hypothetical protein
MCVGFIDVIVADHLPSGNKKAISVNVKKTSRFGKRSCCPKIPWGGA